MASTIALCASSSFLFRSSSSRTECFVFTLYLPRRTFVSCAAGGSGSSTPGSPGGGVPGAGDSSTTAARGPSVPRVVGPPRTGAEPLPAGSFPWWLLLGFVAGAGTAGTVLTRRVHASRVRVAATQPRRP